MRSIQTQFTFPLSSVKPLEGLMGYRAFCLEATRRALADGAPHRRERSPVTGAPLETAGTVGGMEYLRCPDTGSVLLAELPPPERWARLLEEVTRFRHSPQAFHAGLAQSRTDHVYEPKLEWIQDALRLQGVERPRLLEVVTPPSDFTALLRESGTFAEVLAVPEMALAHEESAAGDGPTPMEAAVLLESLDRVDDPAALLRAVARRLADGGMLFVTALVRSGFDMAVLGLRNLYLCPPDRTNCFSLAGLSSLVQQAGFTLLEVSTPGVLDVEIVRAHLAQDPSLPLSPFEREVLDDDEETQAAFQTFLQQRGLSSFARIVGRKAP